MTEFKHVREMTDAEMDEALRVLKRGPPPEPMPTDKLARDMSEAERQEWLKEHIKRTRS